MRPIGRFTWGCNEHELVTDTTYVDYWLEHKVEQQTQSIPMLMALRHSMGWIGSLEEEWVL